MKNLPSTKETGATLSFNDIVAIWQNIKTEVGEDPGENFYLIDSSFFSRARIEFREKLLSLGFSMLNSGRSKIVLSRKEDDFVVKIQNNYWLSEIFKQRDKELESAIYPYFLRYLYVDDNRAVLIQPKIERELNSREFRLIDNEIRFKFPSLGARLDLMSFNFGIRKNRKLMMDV